MSLFHRIQTIALALGVLAMFTVPAAALAEPGQANNAASQATQKSQPGCPVKRGKHHGCDIMKQLNLTDQQREQLKAMHDKFKSTHPRDCGNGQGRREEMQKLRQDPEANKDKIDAMRAEMKQKREAYMAERNAELQKILSPEQFSKMESLRKQCQAKSSGGKGYGKGHGKRHGQGSQAPSEGE